MLAHEQEHKEIKELILKLKDLMEMQQEEITGLLSACKALRDMSTLLKQEIADVRSQLIDGHRGHLDS